MKKILMACAVISAFGIVEANAAPYVGGSLGVNVNTSSNSSGSRPGNYRGVPAKIFAGYGTEVTENVYLGGEVGATLGNFEMNNKNKMKTSYGYNLSVMPGLILNDNTTAFGRVGFARTRFTNVSKLTNGAVLGLGLQTNVTQHVDLRGEYDYTAYSSVGVISAPRTDEFSLALAYKFD